MAEKLWGGPGPNSLLVGLDILQSTGPFPSPDLAQAALDRALDDFEKYPPMKKIPFRGGWASLLAAGVIGALVWSGTLPPQERFLWRLWGLMPQENLAGLVAISPGDVTYLPGDGLEIFAETPFPGVAPKIRLWVAGVWEERTMTPESDKNYRIPLSGLTDLCRYQFRWKGRRSRTFTLTPYHPPSLESVDVVIVPPSYLAEAPRSGPPSSLEVPEGGRVIFKTLWSEPLKNPRVVWESRDKEIEIPAQSDHEQLTFNLKVTTPGSLAVSADLGPFGRRERARWRLQVIKDLPPLISLISPGEDLTMELGQSLPLTYEASDDHRLASIDLFFRVNGGTPTLRALPLPQGSDTVTWPWFLQSLGLSPKDTLTFYLTARDHKPGVARTPTRTLTMTVPNFAPEETQANLERALAELDPALKQEQSSFDQLSSTVPAWGEAQSDHEQAMHHVNRARSFLRSTTPEVSDTQPLYDDLRQLLSGSMSESRQNLNQQARAKAQSSLTSSREELRRLTQEIQKTLSELTEDLAQEAGEDFENVLDDWLTRLNQESSDKLSDELRSELSQALEALAQQAHRLATQWSKAAGPSSISGPVRILSFGPLHQALQEMAEALARGDRAGALAALQRAREILREMKELMKQATGGQSGETGMGQETSPRFGKGRRGRRGARRSPVPVPGRKDFHPSTSFREDMEKSLQEPTPARKKELIRDYFEQWLK